MRRKNTIITGAMWLAVLWLCLGAGQAIAQVDLRWSPADTSLAPGQSARLSVHLDQALEIRTFEVWVTYDPTVITSLDGGPGQIFTDSGFFIFEDFDNDPGQWHGLAVVMGAGVSVSGPGELFTWDIQGLEFGVCPIETVNVVLFDGQAPPESIADVSLDSASILVQDPPSAAQDVPAASGRLALYPNPFNPSVQVSFRLEEAVDAQLTVHDTRGRQVATLGTGLMAAGQQSFHWDGKDAAGHIMPAGVYVFRLEAGAISEQAKAVLIK